ncbi:MAG: HD domain-containing protein [Lachnospiraceae bacterium]|nr:HD domain-containing protein [Lachnospiraceae bacterium]
MNDIYKLSQSMIDFDKGDPKRIQHFLKVHSFAKLIGEGENLDEKTLFILEAAALTHDIGIKPAEEKYGSCSGKLQEQEGPAPAREMLTALEFDEDIIDRVCFLIAHHHTYNQVDGADYQILLEADALVNLFEDGLSTAATEAALKNIFRTETGIHLCKTMFAV